MTADFRQAAAFLMSLQDRGLGSEEMRNIDVLGGRDPVNKGVEPEKRGTRAKSCSWGGAWRAGAWLGWRLPAPISSPSEMVLWGLGLTWPCRESQLQRGLPTADLSAPGLEKGGQERPDSGVRRAHGDKTNPSGRSGLHTVAKRQERACCQGTVSKGRGRKGTERLRKQSGNP